jgi:hypothetical protein
MFKHIVHVIIQKTNGQTSIQIYISQRFETNETTCKFKEILVATVNDVKSTNDKFAITYVS